MYTPRPLPPYFLVRVLKQEEKKSKSTIGSFILPETITFMANNTQCGEIVDIGARAAKAFPEAKVGHILLMHHFVQANDENEARVDHLIHDDELYNYYIVTAYDYPGKGNETYGVWDGEKIIPHQDFVFLETEPPAINNLTPDEAINKALKKTESGLFLFNEWKESREQKEQKQADLKREAEELAKSGTQKLHIKQGIVQREWEMEAIGREVNQQSYLPYSVAVANPVLSEWFGKEVVPGDTLAMLNVACQTIIKFDGKEYIVSKVKFIAGLYDTVKVA